MTHLRTTFVLLLLVGPGLSNEPDKERLTPPPASTILAEFDVEGDGDALVVPVNIRGHSAIFLLDTGAATTILDTWLAARVGMKRLSQRKYPTGMPKQYELPDGVIGEGESSIQLEGDAAWMDLSPLQVQTGHEITGILGISALKNHIIRVDFDRGKMWFLRSFTSSSAARFPISEDQLGRPTITITCLGNRSIPLLIDTGMIGPGIGEVEAGLFSDLLKNNQITLISNSVNIATIAGEVQQRRGQLNLFQVGLFRHRHLPLREGTLNAIGLDYLSRYTFTLDLKSNNLYLESNRRFDLPPLFDMSGLTLIRSDAGIRVAQVNPAGPAFNAAVQAGDYIVSIDGHTTDNMRLMEVRRRLARIGERVKLTVRRAFKVETIEFELANWQHVELGVD